MWRKTIGIILCCSMFILMASAAASGSESSDAGEGGHKLNALLLKAASYEASAESHEGYWQAAAIYCEASRLGSTEAQYRLGMLYAFGKGVPENRAFAASLFSMASHQGHQKAFDMLETVNFKSQELPACVTSETLPEKRPAPVPAPAEETAPIDRYLESLPRSKSWIIDLANKISDWYEIDPKLVLSIITVESEFETKARSPKSAMGLMQLIPATAERFNVKNAFDASQNIRGGIKYLRWLLSYYRGNIELTTAAYNAGEKAVDRYLGIPPYAETREYVKRLKRLYRRSTHPYDENLTGPSPILMKRANSRK
jgi:soluble lytic murein transglycosylase-like protein